jgi:hypothetical protein
LTVQAINKVLLVGRQTFNIDGYTTISVDDPALLLVLPGKTRDKRTKAKSLNEAFNIDFQMGFINVRAF